ncbi:MAG: hypothetical protein JW751_00925 [Polyangiaceae bacterium]|nr:hypothetical protein [Polyangiaceae bacterium]
MSKARNRNQARRLRAKRLTLRTPEGDSLPADPGLVSGVPQGVPSGIVPVVPSDWAPQGRVSGAMPAVSADIVREDFDATAPTSRRFFDRASRLALVIDHLRVALIRDDQQYPVVWSVGCGTGKELFSLAIAAAEDLGPLARQLRFVGSDRDALAIAAARGAIYERPFLRGVRDRIVRRHFERVEAGHYAIAQTHRRRVEFHHATPEEMADRLPSGSVVVALCRCAKDEHAREDWTLRHRVIAGRLAPGGFLVQEPTDPSPDPFLLEGWGEPQNGIFVKRGPPPREVPSLPCRDRPLSVRPECSISTIPSPPQRDETRARLAGAAELGERGEIDGALLLATEALRLEPNDPLSYLVRAQLQLAGGSVEGALDDLRRLLFLAPNCRLARYWYVLALRAARRYASARVQLEELQHHLGDADDAELVEDEITTVGDLRLALATMRTPWHDPPPKPTKEGDT